MEVSKLTPNDSCLLVFMSRALPSPWLWAANEQNIVQAMGCSFQGKVIKRPCTPYSLLGLLPLMEASFQVIRQPWGETHVSMEVHLLRSSNNQVSESAWKRVLSQSDHEMTVVLDSTWVQPLKRPWARTTQVSSSQILDPWKLEEHKCFLFSAATFWGDLLCGHG